MQSISVPVIALSDITVVEVEVYVIVSAKVIGGVKERSCAHNKI